MRLLTSILFATAVSWAAHAHETRPTIATLNVDTDRTVTLTIDTNAEALLAGIGPEHDDTTEAPNAQLYEELRALPSQELEARIRGFLPQYLSAGPVMARGSAVALDPVAVEVPEVGDTQQARDTIMRFTGTLPDEAETFGWAYPNAYGASVLRIERPGEDVEGRLFAAGEGADDLRIGVPANRTWWGRALNAVTSIFE